MLRAAPSPDLTSPSASPTTPSSSHAKSTRATTTPRSSRMRTWDRGVGRAWRCMTTADRALPQRGVTDRDRLLGRHVPDAVDQRAGRGRARQTTDVHHVPGRERGHLLHEGRTPADGAGRNGEPDLLGGRERHRQPEQSSGGDVGERIGHIGTPRPGRCPGPEHRALPGIGLRPGRLRAVDAGPQAMEPMRACGPLELALRHALAQGVGGGEHPAGYLGQQHGSSLAERAGPGADAVGGLWTAGRPGRLWTTSKGAGARRVAWTTVTTTGTPAVDAPAKTPVVDTVDTRGADPRRGAAVRRARPQGRRVRAHPGDPRPPPDRRASWPCTP